MTGDTQLVEGVHLTGGDTWFVASQANHVGLMIRGVKTQYTAKNKHGRVVSVLNFFISYLFTSDCLDRQVDHRIYCFA